MEERIVQLETKLSYLEDFMQQLQEVVVGQAKQIDSLHAETRLMAEKLRELSESAEGEIPSRKPPHY